MVGSFEEFLQRVERLNERINEACRKAGRSPGDVTLMAVTKERPVEAAEWAARSGLSCVGENKAQEGVEKIRQAGKFKIRWELIGHLQSNKARLAAEYFDRIQSVDSVKLITRLDRVAEELDRTLPVLLQVNAGDDPAKFGASLAEAPRLLEAALGAPRLRVDGLMTIAPLAEAPEVALRAFILLRELRDRLAAHYGVPLPELSMGMTGDLEEAIAAGATLVRVGAALYGEKVA